MFSFKQLYQSTLKLSLKRKNPSISPDIRLDKIIPFAGVKACLFQISMRGVTQARVRHRVNILVTDLDIKRQPTTDPDYFEFEDKDGKFWVKKPNPSKDQVRVRCSCHDHYFTWGWWNYLNDTIFGTKPRPYKRKTAPPPIGYPYRNPIKVVGICKHLIHSVRFLERRKIFK